MAITGNTQLSPTKQTIVAAMVQKELAFAAKLLPTVSDWSALAGSGMNVLNIPRAGSFTPENRASGTAGTDQVSAFAVDPINLNLRAYISWIVDSVDQFQSNVDVQGHYMKIAGTGHGRYVDTNIIATLEATYSNTATTGAMSFDKVVNARQYLVERFADLQQTFFVASPACEAAMLKLDEYKRADIYGQSILPNFVPVGYVYGMPVIVHAGLSGNIAYVYEKSGVGFALQMQPNMSVQLSNDYGSQAGRVAVDQVFGVGGLQLATLGAAAGKSPLVYKITNT